MNLQVKDLDTIHPGKGLGPILFGSTVEEVIGILGEPDYRETDDLGNVDLSYESQNLTFSFSRDDNFYLYHIGTERETLTLIGCKLFGKDEYEIKKFIQQKLKARISEEDGCIHENGLIQTWIDVDELNISFWFHDDELYLIDLFCDTIDVETYNWPENSTAAKKGS